MANRSGPGVRVDTEQVVQWRPDHTSGIGHHEDADAVGHQGFHKVEQEEGRLMEGQATCISWPKTAVAHSMLSARQIAAGTTM